MKLTREQEIILAGLFHDIGKVLQRTGVTLKELGVDEYDFQNILPFKDGHYTHQHALFTYLFLLKAKENGWLPQLADFERQDYNLLLMAARHHSPTSLYELIISEADRISAGMDRKEYEEASFKSKTYILERLSSVFEEVVLVKNKFDGFNYRYPLDILKPDAIFPKKAEDILPDNRERACLEYATIWHQFEVDFARLKNIEPFANYLEALISSLECYFWAVPSATYGSGKKVWTDISLYDHLLTTSSIAYVLYQYHYSTSTMDEKNIKDRNQSKYLLINMDLSGIQQYIFNITADAAKGAARMLRARSFYLNLIMEGAFRLLCQRLELYSVNRLMDAGGRAIILAPNLPEYIKKLRKLREKIDQFCLDNFNGELSLNLSWLPATGRDFELDNFATLLIRVSQKAEEAKQKKFSAYIGKKEYHKIEKFWRDYDPQKGLCHVCGKLQAKVRAEEVSERYYCNSCSKLAELGRKIVRYNYLAYKSGENNLENRIPVPGGYFVFSQEIPKENSWEIIWSISKDKDVLFAVKRIANYVPIFEDKDKDNPIYTDKRVNDDEDIKDAEAAKADNRPKTFHQISLSALRHKNDGTYEGRPYLAVFKADIDNLGFIFGYGLRESGSDNRLTIGRYATLSRMIDRFFTVYLPHLFTTDERFRDTYTVFAGGDDLFLIGPWTNTFLLAHQIYTDFRRYTCTNPDITLSGTLNLMKSKHPVNFMAHVAEKGLDEAKSESPEKNSLHIWDKVIDWKNYEKIIEWKDRIDQLINAPNSKVSKGFIYDFLKFKEMRELFRKGYLEYGNYISLFRYKLARLKKEDMPDNVIEKLVLLFNECVEGDKPLYLAIQWALYLNRKLSIRREV